jgi:hypothetical protein
MRKFFVTTFVLAAMLCLATSALALEKKAALATDRADDWNAVSTCVVTYYNTCTGWLWVWSGFGDDGKLGLCVDSCCSAGQASALNQSIVYVLTSAPPGYGFTGSIDVRAGDAQCCPTGPAIASQPLLPTNPGNRLQLVNWGGVSVPNRFVITLTLQEDQGFASPAGLGTDHPAAGPTGPQACGSCYPATRPIHTFFYGTSSTVLCPGSTLNDGICDAELLWDVNISCVVSVDESSWGSIKSLYK